MYIEEFEKVDVTLKHYSQPSKWEKSLGYKPEINKSFKVHWSLLKSKRDYRVLFIKVKCDDCGIVHERRIRDLNPADNYHLCKNCVTKGERNVNFGKPINENFRKAYKKLLEEKGNPFTWESSKKKIKEKNGWSKQTWKIGFKHSEESKNKMSLSAIESFKKGIRKVNSGWGNVKIKQYNGIDYQGTYELKFLKYVESLNKLDEIERGPSMNYYDDKGKEHVYFIDYKIKNTNIVFEIKSDYLWDKNRRINEIKMSEAQKIYNYNLVINNNFEKIKCIFT